MSKRFPESVSLWHPYQDKPGQRHKLALWSDFQFDSVDETINSIAGGQYYAMADNLLDRLEVDPDLLRDKRCENYVSRTGGMLAIRARSKRKCGYIINSDAWKGEPSKQLLEKMKYIFDLFGYEALTPASLSEKILRMTLGRQIIPRPTVMLRSALLENLKGGRIDTQKTAKYYPIVYENDINKAYL